MWLTDLADVCRTSGLEVIEVDGWRTRGHGPMTDVLTIIDHHTATPDDVPGDYPSLAVVRDGRPGLDGPLSQLGLGRSGAVYVIAAGLSYHAGAVRDTSYSNWHAIGIEGESAGAGRWTAAQRDAWPRLNAALCRGYHLPAHRVLAHREVCDPVGRKPDPTGIDMGEQRTEVQHILTADEPLGDGDPIDPPEEEDDMKFPYLIIADAGRGGPAYAWTPLSIRAINGTQFATLVRTGQAENKINFLPSGDFDGLKDMAGAALRSVAAHVDAALADDFAGETDDEAKAPEADDLLSESGAERVVIGV